MTQDIMEYRRLAHKLAQKYIRLNRDPSVDYEDLVSEAMLGIYLAGQRFDPDKGASFMTFAYTTASGYIKRFMDTKSGHIRYPAHIISLAEKIVMEDMTDSTVSEIVTNLNTTEYRASLALECIRSRYALELDKPQTNYSAGITDTESDYAHLAPAEDDLTGMIAEEFLLTLRSRDRFIVTELMDGRYQREIGKLIGTSHQYVQQRVIEIRKRLTEYLDKSEKVAMHA